MEMVRKQDVPDRPAAADKVYTTGSAAKICGVSQQTIIRCFDAGKLKGFRVPGSTFRRITRVGLFAFMVEYGIPLDDLGELSPEEVAAVAAKHGTPEVVQTTLKLTTADRLTGVA